jgi:predicted AlkP superfamily phosphohydrolase/phosphomutase/tetratricopeptide (TPR) repeat protein
MPDRKVLLIGWDAADWNVARPLIAQGKMPALKRLMDEGVSANLATIRPILSPMLWTSIATGKRAWKHGIHGFSEPCPATGGIRPITNLSRKTKAVWNIFNQQEWKSTVIGWWPSHPAEPINGVMISNHFQQAVKDLGEDWPMQAGTVHPRELEEPLKEMRIHPAELGNAHILPFIPRAGEIDQEKDKRMESCAKILAEISGIHAGATACIQVEPWDFMAVYYDGIDHFGHGFMRYHPPRQPWVSQTDYDLYNGVIEACYRYHDMMLDTLMKLAGEDTTIMLISDHGFEPGNLRPQLTPNEPAGPAAEHSPFGIFCLRGPGIKKGEQIAGATLLDITPTLLQLYGLPVGRDMDGKVLLNCFTDLHEIAYVDSWDEIAGNDGRHPEGRQIDAVAARESLKQLVDLGYIDEPNPDRGAAIDETIRELQYNLAQAYMDGGRFEDAISILEKQWDRWPQESRFGTKLFQCCLAMKDPGLSRQAFEKIVERKQEAIITAGEELKAIKEAQAAEIAEAKEAAEKEGKPYAPKEVPRALIQKMKRLSRHTQMNPHALAFFEGSLLALEGNHAEALVVFEQAVGVQEANRPSLFCKMAASYFELKRWDDADAYYHKALSAEPNNQEAHLGLASILIEKKDYFAAAAEALASIELVYENPKAHSLYGRALMLLRKPKLAEQSLQIAISQNPNYAVAHELLARLYTKRLKNPEKAAFHRQRVVDIQAQASERRLKLSTTKISATAFPELLERLERLNSASGEPLIVVSGLPRSGTSLMMQMLAAAGLPLVTDETRKADASNPKGYYEDERVKRLAVEKDTSWLFESRGKAIKIVAPLLRSIPEDLPTKIIFMERAPAEVIQSQRRMLAHDGKTGANLDDESLYQSYAKLFEHLNKLTAEREHTELLSIKYTDAINDPKGTALRVAEFLGRNLEIDAMATVVDDTLYRNR